MGTTTCGGKGFKERSRVSGKGPTGAASLAGCPGSVSLLTRHSKRQLPSDGRERGPARFRQQCMQAPYQAPQRIITPALLSLLHGTPGSNVDCWCLEQRQRNLCCTHRATIHTTSSHRLLPQWKTNGPQLDTLSKACTLQDTVIHLGHGDSNNTLHVFDVLELVTMWQRPNNAYCDSTTSGAHVLHKRVWRKHGCSGPGTTQT